MLTKRFVPEERLVRALLAEAGETEPALRRAVLDAAAELRTIDTPTIPDELRRYLDKVSHNAYKVIDADIEALLDQGYTQDAVFELTVSVAVGAGLGRLARGLDLLAEDGREREERHEIV